MPEEYSRYDDLVPFGDRQATWWDDLKLVVAAVVLWPLMPVFSLIAAFRHRRLPFPTSCVGVK